MKKLLFLLFLPLMGMAQTTGFKQRDTTLLKGQYYDLHPYQTDRAGRFYSDDDPRPYFKNTNPPLDSLILDDDFFKWDNSYIATKTEATMIRMMSGRTSYYANTDLIVGEPFAPKEVDFNTYVGFVFHQKWEDYKKECYADSTKLEYSGYCTHDDCFERKYEKSAKQGITAL